MKAQLLTMSTPDGPVHHPRAGRRGPGFRLDRRARRADRADPPELRPAEVEAVADLGPISRAVEAFYAGDPAPAMAVPVLQKSGPFRSHAWDVLRTVRPGRAGDVHRVRRTVGQPQGGPGRGQRLRLQRRSPVRAVPPRDPYRRLPGRLPLGAGDQGEPAGAGGKGKPAGPRSAGEPATSLRDPDGQGTVRQVNAVGSSDARRLPSEGSRPASQAAMSVIIR